MNQGGSRGRGSRMLGEINSSRHHDVKKPKWYVARRGVADWGGAIAMPQAFPVTIPSPFSLQRAIGRALAV